MRGIIVLMLVMVFAVSGVEAAELKIGYVDLYRALNESAYGIKAKETLEKMVKEKQAVIDRKGMEIQRLEDELQRQASVITPEAKRQKENEINRLRREYQQLLQESQEELRKKERELTQEILKDLKEIISKIGESQGYAIIFEGGKNGIILYSRKGFDLTDVVIKRYNELKK